MLLLWLPAFEMATGFVDVQQIEENRRRAAFPAPQELIHPIAFVRGVQLWFEDNYGFRDLLIRTKTQIDYSLFGVTSRVYVGHDGWLFFRSVIDHQEPQDEQLTDADLDQIIGNFAHLRDFLAARGIRLIVITNELKDHFYPEQLPAAAAFAKRRHRFDDFRARMHALPGIIYIDPTPILTTVQRQRPIFHKTDFHWNDPAAFEVAKILVDTIAAEEHRGVPFWRYQLSMETRDFSGTTAMFMPIFHAPHEQALFVKQNWPSVSLEVRRNVGPFEWITCPKLDRHDVLPPAALFGDSFADGMTRSGLFDYFEQLARVRRHQADLSDMLQALPRGTRYVIVQFIEVGLPEFLSIKLPRDNSPTAILPPAATQCAT